MKHRYFLTFAAFIFSAFQSQAQTYAGGGGAIPNTGITTYYNVSVSGLSQATLDGTFGIEEVCIDITHSKDLDIIVSLVSPNGTTVELTSLNGDVGANYSNTCFNATAAESITSGTAPFTGSFKPEGFMGDFNDGQNGNGTWKLAVKDWDAGNVNSGTLNWFTIKFSNSPVQPISFTSSNLPIIVINTNGAIITDEPKVNVDLGVIYNGQGIRNNLTDAFNNYNGKADIEYRGSSSQQFPKKSYGFETVSNLGTKQDVPLLGMPAEHDWILNATYIDKSLLRNWLTYNLSNQMGQYAARSQYVELVVDGKYRGVYVLMEKIKRDNDRVDIAKLDINENTGDDLTGGYILKIDKQTGSGGSGFYSKINSFQTTKKVFFLYDYPNEDSLTSAQKIYIESYIDEFESVIISGGFADPINGYRKYIDETTFMDYMILQEFSKNVDGYRISTFLYKDKDSNGGKLKIGPLWDFDIAWGNINYGNGNVPTDFEYWIGDTSFPRPVWFSRLMEDQQFVTDLKCRWNTLRQGILNSSTINSQIDAQASYINEAQARNFTRWPVIGTNIFSSPSPYPTSWQEEVNNLKNWVTNRGIWIDNNLPGICVVGVNEIASGQNVKVYPNPFENSANINFTITEKGRVSLKIFDALGKEVSSLINDERNPGKYDVHFDGSTLSPGMYYYQLRTGNNMTAGKMVMNKN
jgi:subtilisin-like proprotein convertase family protein